MPPSREVVAVVAVGALGLMGCVGIGIALAEIAVRAFKQVAD